MAEFPTRLGEVTGFQWDAGNDTKTWSKHAVTRAECEQTFLNAPLIVADDARHSVLEERHFALGRTDRDRRLFIVFTLRGTLIRIISARPKSRREREEYLNAEAQQESEQ